jgi:GDP-L-fucose synthase
MKSFSNEELVNIGTGEDISIADFARLVALIVDMRPSSASTLGARHAARIVDVTRLAKLRLVRTHHAPRWRMESSLRISVRRT